MKIQQLLLEIRSNHDWRKINSPDHSKPGYSYRKHWSSILAPLKDIVSKFFGAKLGVLFTSFQSSPEYPSYMSMRSLDRQRRRSHQGYTLKMSCPLNQIDLKELHARYKEIDNSSLLTDMKDFLIEFGGLSEEDLSLVEISQNLFTTTSKASLQVKIIWPADLDFHEREPIGQEDSLSSLHEIIQYLMLPNTFSPGIKVLMSEFQKNVLVQIHKLQNGVVEVESDASLLVDCDMEHFHELVGDDFEFTPKNIQSIIEDVITRKLVKIKNQNKHIKKLHIYCYFSSLDEMYVISIKCVEESDNA